MHQSRSLSGITAGCPVYERLLHNARLCFAGHAPGCHNRSLLCTTCLYATRIRHCYVTANRVIHNAARHSGREGGKERFAHSRVGVNRKDAHLRTDRSLNCFVLHHHGAILPCSTFHPGPCRSPRARRRDDFIAHIPPYRVSQANRRCPGTFQHLRLSAESYRITRIRRIKSQLFFTME